MLDYVFANVIFFKSSRDMQMNILIDIYIILTLFRVLSYFVCFWEIVIWLNINHFQGCENMSDFLKIQVQKRLLQFNLWLESFNTIWFAKIEHPKWNEYLSIQNIRNYFFGQFSVLKCKIYHSNLYFITTKL